MKKYLIAALFIASSSSFAQDAYVTDKFTVAVRSGEAADYRILRMLRTGTKVEVISQNRETGYSKIRFNNGKEGFVLTRQLLDEPIARDRLADLEKEMALLKGEPDELKSKLADATQKATQFEKSYKAAEARARSAEQELAAFKRISSDAVSVAEERNSLREQVAELNRDLAEAKQETLELENNDTQHWFLIGASVLLGGIILGLILPNLRSRRPKQSWDSL
jgi:SH3 domain protein